MEMIIKDVRCFCGVHSISLRPLTLLVGENSSGKSTFLAMLSALSGPWFPSAKQSFSLPPYDIGSFDSIATFKGGRYGRAHHFTIGYSIKRKNKETRAIATYSENYGKPELSDLELSVGETILKLKIENGKFSAQFNTPETKAIKKDMRTFSGDIPTGTELSLSTLPSILASKLLDRTQGQEIEQEQYQFLSTLFNMIHSASIDAPEIALSIAPIRTKPRRTYDEVTDEFKPEGDHIPQILAKIWALEESNKTKATLHDALIEFGINAGLFKDIDVKMLGHRPSSPFQITVKVSGPFTNLSDVGYGVSQSLPVIVESMLASKERRLLLQQPEVHLHPKAQAALGTFIARLVTTKQKQFVVETHSDYVVDRVRQEIANGNLACSSVLLLFFDKKASETTIHQIEFDKNGNIIAAPPTYREFFLDEEMNLIKRTLSDVPNR